MLAHDHDISFGASAMGIAWSWFGIDAKRSLVAASAGVYLLALVRVFSWHSAHPALMKISRRLAAASILLWMVVFNHKAESATFVIAVAGIGLWWSTVERIPLVDVLILLTMVLTVLSPTDLFPRAVRERWVLPYALKALPCLLIWVRIQQHLLLRRAELVAPEVGAHGS